MGRIAAAVAKAKTTRPGAGAPARKLRGARSAWDHLSDLPTPLPVLGAWPEDLGGLVRAIVAGELVVPTGARLDACATVNDGVTYTRNLRDELLQGPNTRRARAGVLHGVLHALRDQLHASG